MKSTKHIKSSSLLLAGVVLMALALVWGMLRASSDSFRVVFREEYEGETFLFLPPKWQPQSIEDGVLVTTSRDRYPKMTAAGLPEITTGPLDVLRVNMAFSGTETTRMSVLFQRDHEDTWRGISKEIAASPDFQWYELHLSADRTWQGRITAFRIDPVNTPEVEMRIDRIELLRSSAAYSTSFIRAVATRILAGASAGPVPVFLIWLSMWGIMLWRPPRQRWRICLWIGFLALLPRLLYATIPLLDSLEFSDPGTWKEHALAIWRGEELRGTPLWGIAWQAALALLYGPSEGAAVFPVRIFLCLLDTATTVLVFMIARFFFKRRAALFAALLYAAAEEAIRLTGMLYCETFYTFWICLFIYAALLISRRRVNMLHVVLFMLSSLFMIQTRSQALLLLPACVLWMWWRRDGARALKTACYAGIAVAAAVAINLALSFAQFGEPVFFQTGIGLNLAIGNNPEADGGWATLPEAWQESRASGLEQIKNDSMYMRRALSFIRENPGRSMHLAVKKVLMLIDPFQKNHWLYSPDMPVPLLPRAAIWLLFIPGIIAAVSKLRHLALPLAHIVLTGIIVLVFFYNIRFVVPIIPAMSIIGAAAFDAVLRKRVASSP